VHSADRFGAVPVERSLYASTAKAVTPVFAPAGFGDWHTASALMTGFVAKEAVISTWAQTYAAQQPAGEPGAGATSPGTSTQALGAQVRAHFAAASGGHPEAAAWAFLVFLLAYTPCVATLAAQKREIGLRWTAFGMVLQLGTAWLAAVAVFQVGRLFG
jgi:ferrous iron transport protein B